MPIFLSLGLDGKTDNYIAGQVSEEPHKGWFEIPAVQYGTGAQRLLFAVPLSGNAMKIMEAAQRVDTFDVVLIDMVGTARGDDAWGRPAAPSVIKKGFAVYDATLGNAKVSSGGDEPLMQCELDYTALQFWYEGVAPPPDDLFQRKPVGLNAVALSLLRQVFHTP